MPLFQRRDPDHEGTKVGMQTETELHLTAPERNRRLPSMQRNQGHANNETTVPEQVLELMPNAQFSWPNKRQLNELQMESLKDF